MKVYTKSVAEMKQLLAQSFTLCSIAYFVSNPVCSYILEKK